MKLEHVAFDVADPDGMANWWVKNLGFEIVFKDEGPSRCRFIRDSSGQMTFELYHNPPTTPVPDYPNMDPLNLHIAIWSEDVEKDASRLVKAGAKKLSSTHKPGLDLVMLRDPWGMPLQFVHRAKPMLKA